MKDLFGMAILDYQTQNSPENIITETSISEADEMEVAYLFRGFDAMPGLEQLALEESRGKVLDVGCGAGSHSLYLQNDRGLGVLPIDISPNAVKACKLRGLNNATIANVLDLDPRDGKFDTILLLMNGTGIFGKLAQVDRYLQKLKSLLLPGGQILIDSSDIIYMFDDDEDGGTEGEAELSEAKWIPSTDYYGELLFTISYKGEKEAEFHWLYMDYHTLENAALANGFQCELIKEGLHYDYLARLH